MGSKVGGCETSGMLGNCAELDDKLMGDELVGAEDEPAKKEDGR